jgi:hypothetical protein
MLHGPRSWVTPLVILGLAIPSPGSQTSAVSISHAAIGCAVVDRFVEIEATLTPPASVARARVMFRGADSEHWYFAPLAADRERAGRFVGHIPKPLDSLKAFEYYLTATDTSFGEARTPDRRVTIVPRNVTCSTGPLARSAASLAARLVVSALGGGAPLPAGFASSGVIAGAAAGATTAASGGGSAAGAAGAAGAGGGISGTTIAIVGGVAAAGGIAAAAGGSGGSSGGSSGGGTSGGGTGGGGSTPTPTPGATPTPSPGGSPTPSPGGGVIYVVTIPAPFIDVSNCSGQMTTFGGWNISTAAADGTFNEVHSVMTPVLRVVGQITSTSMNANLSCLNGAGTGSMSASGSNFSLSGTFTFNGRTGPFSVRRQ